MEGALTVVEHPTGSSDLADVRSAMMHVGSENIPAMLAEYSKRRKEFRDWLRGQLIEGLHYGYPPGCEPKLNEDGWVGVWTKSGTKFYPPGQWTPKPSFYKAGADFVCELMNVRDTYEADMAAHQQLGSPKETFVFSCKLISRATGEVLGEGRGVRRVGQKGGDENNAIKMAKKSAKVDAVLNAYGLADLFTQDLETPPIDPPDAPSQVDGAPNAKPRTERVSKAECGQLFKAWKAWRLAAEQTASAFEFEEWATATTGMPAESVAHPSSWMRTDFEKCMAIVRGEA